MWRWSVDLGRGAGLTPYGHGNLLVTTGDFILALGPEGTERWRVDTQPASGATVPLPGDRLARVEGEDVVWRSFTSGEVLGSVPAPGAVHLTADPWGGLVYVSRGSVSLSRIAADGSPVWTVPLHPAKSPRFLTAPPSVLAGGGPVVLADRLVQTHDDALLVIEADGTTRAVAAPSDSTVWLRPQRVGPSAALVGLRWARTANVLFLLDAADAILRPYAEELTTTHPVTALPGPDGDFLVAIPAHRREIRPMEWDYGVVMLDAAGQQLWEHRTAAPPASLSAGAHGEIIVAGTPAYVTCLGPHGELRWSWTPPGPISHLPVVGADGTVYGVCQGTIWALAGVAAAGATA